MYVVLVNDDNTLSASKKQRIIQRSKLVDTLWFLVNPIYNGYDLTNSTVLLEYLKPVSKEYETEVLELSGKYEEYLKYVLPVDTAFTKEAGSLEIQLTFLYTDIDVDGNSVQRVRKTAPKLKIEVIPISAWSDIIPDSALSAIDQRIIKTQAQIKELECYADIIADAKADNLKYNENENSLQLLSGDKEIGDKVVLNTNGESLKDGVPIVDINESNTPPNESGESTDDDGVVEF